MKNKNHMAVGLIFDSNNYGKKKGRNGLKMGFLTYKSPIPGNETMH